jgi:hypothetical protein
MMRKIIAVLALILFYLAVGALLLEGGIRLAHAAPPAESPGWFWKVPDPITGWSLLPNSKGRWFNQLYEYDVHIEINSRGLRAPEDIGYEKPPGTYRVIVLGDSFVEAAQVELEQSFPQQLRQLLAQQGMNVQVINAGVGGWGTDQELLWLREEGYKYQPDLVLLAVYPRNDFMNNDEALEATNQGAIRKPFYRLENGQLVLNYFPFDPEQVPPVDSAPAPTAAKSEPGPLSTIGQWLHDHSALYRYIDPRIRIVAPKFAAALARTGLIKPGQESKIVAQDTEFIPITYQIYDENLDPEWQTAFDLTQALFAELRSTTEEMGAGLGAVLISAPEQVYPDRWEKIQKRFPTMQEGEWNLDFPRTKAQELLAQLDIPVLDLVPIFQQTAKHGPLLHLVDDGHWTPEGHALAATAIYNFVGETALIPQVAGNPIPVDAPSPARTTWQWIVLIIVGILVLSFVWDMVKSGPISWLRKLGVGLATAGELLIYMSRQRQFVLLPLVVVLLLFGGLLIIAQASVVGPFIYTLF